MDKQQELQEQHSKLVQRIKHLENDLETPMSSALDENAQEFQNRDILYRLYQIEKENLIQIENKIKAS
jgi:RNA polymerase-binding transcription factor DksA